MKLTAVINSKLKNMASLTSWNLLSNTQKTKSFWKVTDLECCESYGRKRDKQIMLSSTVISWEYIAVILAFSNHCIFFLIRCFCLHLFFQVFLLISTEELINLLTYALTHWHIFGASLVLCRLARFRLGWRRLCPSRPLPFSLHVVFLITKDKKFVGWDHWSTGHKDNLLWRQEKFFNKRNKAVSGYKCINFVIYIVCYIH